MYRIEKCITRVHVTIQKFWILYFEAILNQFWIQEDDLTDGKFVQEKFSEKLQNRVNVHFAHRKKKRSSTLAWNVILFRPRVYNPPKNTCIFSKCIWNIVKSEARLEILFQSFLCIQILYKFVLDLIKIIREWDDELLY